MKYTFRKFGTLLCLTTLCLFLLSACRQKTPEPTPPVPTATPIAQAESPVPATPPNQPAITSQTPSSGSPPAVTRIPNPSPTSEESAEDTGTLVVWHSWSGADGDALNQILANFRQANPDLPVETLFVAYNDLPQSYADAVVAGGGPDIILAPNWWLNSMVEANVVLPLDDLVPAQEIENYWSPAIANLRVNGRLYGLPTNFELVSLYYNRSLIAPERLPQTTDDLLALAQEDPQLGTGFYAVLYHLYWGIPAYGGQLFDDTGRVVLDQNSGAADFLRWLRTADQTPGIFVDLDYGMLIDRFKKGEYAFFVDGPWSTAELREALGDDLGITLLPAGPAGPARPWLSADGVFLNPNNSPSKQQVALQFARYITGAESGSILAQTANRLPAHVQADSGDDPIRQGFIRQAAAALPEPHNPAMEQVWGYAGDMILKVINGVSEPGEAVVEATTLINEANDR